MRVLRDQLSPEQVQFASHQLISTLLQHPRFIHSQHIAIYRAIGHEIDPSGLLSDPRTQKKTFYTPCINAQQQLDFVHIDGETTYQRNAYGIEEPIDRQSTIAASDLDLVLMPTLALNVDGYRLGYGGGYYDRTFQHATPYLLALIYPFQQPASFTPEAHDLRCDAYICLSTSEK